MISLLFGAHSLAAIASASGGTVWPVWVWLCLFCCFAVGACLGSFANACALRLVRDEDFVSGDSRCRGCDRPLRWHENLPIIGYLRLRGNCACGSMKLSPRYLLVEGILGATAVYYALALPPILAVGLIIAATIAMIALLTDLEAMILHPALLTFLGAAGLGFATFAHLDLFWWPMNLAKAAAGIVIGCLVPFLINKVYYFFRRQNGFGEGDFWLMAGIGAWSGPLGAILIFFAATMLGAIVGIAMILTGRASGTTKLPFGLFISVVFILCPTPNILLF